MATRARILADYVSGGTTAAEFDYLDGVTSNIQTQFTAKAPLASPAFTGSPSITLGSDATGDVYYRAAGGALTRLATGADGTVLTSTGAAAVPAFEAVPAGAMASGTIISYKYAVMDVDSTTYISTSSTTWVGTNAQLNITHAMSNASNILIFSVCFGESWVPASAAALYIGIGKTTALDTNLILYGGDHSDGRVCTIAGNATSSGHTYVYKYAPGATTEFTYQPIQRTASAATGYPTNNNDRNNTIFTLLEIVA